MISSGASYSSKQFNAFALKKYFVRVAPLWNTTSFKRNESLVSSTGCNCSRIPPSTPWVEHGSVEQR